jgi:hypothetical protein
MGLWFETSFMPGRSFTSPADFNDQFAGWLTVTRLTRTLGHTHEKAVREAGGASAPPDPGEARAGLPPEDWTDQTGERVGT